MARTENSVIVRAGIEEVFDLSNDIERWPELFTHYQSARILTREGNKITFELTTLPGTHSGSQRWRSSRIIDREKKKTWSEREDPKFPFEYIKMEWSYEEVEEGTRMTWVQEFKMDPASGRTDDQGVEFMNTTIRREMQSVKEKIEAILSSQQEEGKSCPRSL